MRKIFFFALLILVLAACNAQSGTSNDENDVDLNEEQVENELEETDELEDETEEPEETTQPKGEVESKEVEVATGGDSNSDENANNNNDEGNGAEKPESQHQEIIDLAYDIFDAQKTEDYSFLESNISKGTKIDKENNLFIFEDVTYPHEQDFLTEADLGEIEFRFTHENDKGSVTVGFGLINYEEELSFVVEFEFVDENGNWKMNDMDLNK